MNDAKSLHGFVEKNCCLFNFTFVFFSVGRATIAMAKQLRELGKQKGHSSEVTAELRNRYKEKNCLKQKAKLLVFD